MILLVCVGISLLLLWLVTRIRYQVTETALEITVLGICVRRVALTDIRWISKHRTQWCEKWPNTLFPAKRTLVIERRTGKIKHLLITPKRRYVFKAELQEAVQAARANANESAAALSDTDEDRE